MRISRDGLVTSARACRNDSGPRFAIGGVSQLTIYASLRCSGDLFLAYPDFTGIAVIVRATLTLNKEIFSGIGASPDAEIFTITAIRK